MRFSKTFKVGIFYFPPVSFKLMDAYEAII
jgi:hypothetical protein